MSDLNSPDVQKGREKYYGVGAFILELIKVFIFALIIVVPIHTFVFKPFFVQGASMEPNFEDGEYLIVNELGYKKTPIGLLGKEWFSVNSFQKVERGMVIVFRYPKNPSQFFIKRVVGLPGEKVEIAGNQIKIYNSDYPQGFVLDEKQYLSGSIKTNGTEVINLKDNEYFVLGDNRTASSDSRVWGAVPADDIIGKVWVRAWPFNRLSVF